MKPDTAFALYGFNCIILGLFAIVVVGENEITLFGEFVITITALIAILFPLFIIEKLNQCNCQY